MVVTEQAANDLTIPRIAQLTQKTNQFNMSTKRYGEEEIAKMVQAKDRYQISSFRLEDKFGDHGIVGVVILEKGESSWQIDTFLLSCRAIGREIEGHMLAWAKEQARLGGARELIAEVIPTPKNKPAQDFFQKVGTHYVLT
jgi:FkbH-like protein